MNSLVRMASWSVICAFAGATGLSALGPLGVASSFRGSGEVIQRLEGSLQQMGLRTCATRFQDAAGFLFANGDVDFVLQPLGPNPNLWPTALTSAGAYEQSKQTRLTTLLIAPAGTCAGMYQQVIYWAEACPALKKRVFGSFTNDRVLRGKIMQSEAGPGLQVYLMPAGPGCVSIKKELLR